MPFRYCSSPSTASFANGRRKKMIGSRISIISDGATTTTQKSTATPSSIRRYPPKKKNCNNIHFFPHFQRNNIMVDPSDTYYPATHQQPAQQATTARTYHRDKLMEVHIAEATPPPKKHQAFSHAADHNNKTTTVEEKPVYIMATRSPPSTLTRSDFSTATTGATNNSRMSIVSSMTELTDDCSSTTSSMWSYSEPKPPKLINVAVESTSHPYVQLCFDPEKKTLVTLMEINLGGGNGRVGRSKRLRIVDPDDDEEEEERHEDDEGDDDEYFDGQVETILPPSSGYSGTSGTISRRRRHTNTTSHEEEEKQEGLVVNDRNAAAGAAGVCSEPIVLSCFGPADDDGDSWIEETDLDLYLLHDCCGGADPWNAVATDAAYNRQGCAEALKKLLLASRSLIVFSERAHSSRSFFWTSSPTTTTQGGGSSSSRRHQHEAFTGIGYTVLK